MKLGKINRQSIGISSLTSVLRHYEGMPSHLFVSGSLPKEKTISVAIIGSRKPSAYGKEVTYKLAYDLAREGVVIISGLAYGIDAVAHQAALDAGGTTLAVMANGLHRVYPASHTQLAVAIIQKGGALISEQEPGVDAQKYHFLARNRIVSGLADAVIVTEATDKSGTLSTIAHAMTQNKEVCAVPGPISSLLSVGPNRLLQQGAHVILSAQDVLDIIAPNKAPIQARLPLGTTPLETKIINLIQSGVSDRDALLEASSESPSDTLQALTMLELHDVVATIAGRLVVK